MKIEKLSLVRLSSSLNGEFKEFAVKSLDEESVFVYLGEIPNQPGHCVVAGWRNGKVYSSRHVNEFEVIPEDEV